MSKESASRGMAKSLAIELGERPLESDSLTGIVQTIIRVLAAEESSSIPKEVLSIRLWKLWEQMAREYVALIVTKEERQSLDEAWALLDVFLNGEKKDQS